MRGPSLGTRCPPARPVSPRSPVRVYTLLMAKRGSSNVSSFITPAPLRRRFRVYTVFRDSMATPAPRPGRILLALALAGLFAPAHGADVKPDKKKSQAAYQRGQRADEAGKREEAIAAYTEAIQADAANAAAWRARGQDYMAAGELQKAAADL